MVSFHGVEDHLLPYTAAGARPDGRSRRGARSGRSATAARDTDDAVQATVEQLSYSGCKAPVVLYRVHHNGHTWPGHPLGLDRQTLIDFFSGKGTGKPYPLMVLLGLTPEGFADTISLANPDIDASAMILAFFKQHVLVSAP